MSKIVKLGDVATFVNGYAFKPSDWSNEGLEIIRIQNLTKSSKESNYFEGQIPEKYKVTKGDLLISWSATLGVFEWQGEDAWLNQHIFKVVFDKMEIEKSYFKHLIAATLEEMNRQIHGATMKHITKSKFDAIQIPLPPLTEQKHIAKVLDKADELVKKNKALLQEYNALQQAIFLDMFGDPVTNPKGWEIRTIENFVREEKGSIKRGPFGGALKKEIFVEDGYLVYEQYHALNNDFSFGRYFINESKFQEMKGFEVKPKDIIISCSGVYLGKLAIVPKGSKKGIINQALLKITLDNLKMNNIFFTYHFSHKNFKESFFGSNRGAGIPNFPPMKDFKKFPFIYPPIALQNKFASIIENIEQQKEKAKESLVHSEELFGALVGRYFGNGKDN
jgi:type I restriction enzyme S subunit